MMDNERQYDSWHEQKSRDESAVESPRDPWHITVARLLPDLNHKSVLEVGCGRGDFSIWLGQKYPQAKITGIDFSEVAIATASQRAAQAASSAIFRVDNSEALSFKDASFDYVISCECLEHVTSPARMAGEIARVLKPGGRFILTTENYFNALLLLWMKAWLTGAPFNSGSGVQPHENFFLFWRVKKILERGGLEIEHMESNHYQWLLLPRTDPMKLITFDFKRPFARRLFRPFGRHFTFCGRRVGEQEK